MMARSLVFVLCVLALPLAQGAGGMPSHGTLYMLDIHRLEWQSGGQSRLEMASWVGDEFSQWLLDVDIHGDRRGEYERQFTMGYRRAISPFFDAGIVARRQTGHENRTWSGISLSGTAPYFIHTDLELLAHGGDVLLSVALEHEMPVSRRWVIKSSAEYDGMLSDGGSLEAEVGIRLVYEMPSRLSWYVGYEWQTDFEEDEQRSVGSVGLAYWW